MQVISSIRQLYRYRTLAQILIMRDLKGRYQGTALGFFWIMLNPLLFTVIYAVVFSKIFRFNMENFPVFLFSGLLPWTAFSNSIGSSTYSVTGNGGLIKKVWLPSEIFPLVCVGTHFVHYLFGLPILFLFMALSGVFFSWTLVFFPFILCVQALLTFGLALIVSALSVKFRDFQQMVPNFLLIWFFLTPILYPVNMASGAIRHVLGLNPMVYIISAYQDIFFYGRVPNLLGLLGVAGLSCILLVMAFSFFESQREFIAEEV